MAIKSHLKILVIISQHCEINAYFYDRHICIQYSYLVKQFLKFGYLSVVKKLDCVIKLLLNIRTQCKFSVILTKQLFLL